MLWNSQIKLLHFDLPACVLQTYDRSAVLPDGPHVSTCLLDVDRSMLQTELLWLGCFRLLQEGLRCELRRSECLRQCECLCKPLCSGVRRTCGLCSGLCGSRRVRSGLCGSGCGLCEQLCSELCRSLRHRLWQQWLRSELRRSLWPEGLLCSRCLWS